MKKGIRKSDWREIKKWSDGKGKRTEDRFFEVMVLPSDEIPMWVYGVLRATAEEDAKKIDAVIVADVGKLFIQIKSSVSGLVSFKSKRNRNKFIWCVVIKENHTPKEIRENVVCGLTILRKKVFEKRKGGFKKKRKNGLRK